MPEGLTRRELVARGAGLAAVLALGPAFRYGSSADPRLRSLDKVFRGPIITPGNSLYNKVRLPYNANYDGVMPMAVVRPLGAADVSAVIKWSQHTGVPIVARSGGHSYAGYSTTPGVVV